MGTITKERVSKVVYNALEKNGANMNGFIEIGHREKTDKKLIAMQKNAPKLYAIYMNAMGKIAKLEKSEKIFLCDNVEYFYANTLKKTKKQETVKKAKSPKKAKK